MPDWAIDYGKVEEINDEDRFYEDREFTNLVFQDEFDYEGLPDATLWSFEQGGNGFGNNESQYYTDSIKNAFVKDGILTISALKEDFKDNKYTSTRLITYDKFSFDYGQIDVYAKLPEGKGSWPAIWLLPDSIMNGVSWPLCGEIDIMEHVGKDQDMIHSSLHSQTYNHTKGTQRSVSKKIDTSTTDFHKYTCKKDNTYIEFYYDDILIERFEKYGHNSDSSKKGWPFDQNFFLILNIAVGGNWGGEIDDASLPYNMEIDYVRIYQ